MIFLSQFKFLKKLKLQKCNLKPGFMEYISNDSLYLSLKKLVIFGNQFDIIDLLILSRFKNLENLSITLEANIYRGFAAIYGNMYFPKLNTLFLVGSYITKDTIQFIITQSSLLNLHFVNSAIDNNVFSVNSISTLKYLQKIKFSD
ncbi:hypothetical protein LUQ84_001440 [Hamiltosporidium tvaerminnensis]|nr:hypothetical protein LUQ84_001440 [Hamiltosporidium tvaerminnensis]